MYVTYTLFVRVRAQLLTAFFTRPWLVKCTTFFWLRTLNKFVNILDFAGFGRPPVYSAALMLASNEPESQKTTLSLLGLKAIGDRSNFLQKLVT